MCDDVEKPRWEVEVSVPGDNRLFGTISHPSVGVPSSRRKSSNCGSAEFGSMTVRGKAGIELLLGSAQGSIVSVGGTRERRRNTWFIDLVFKAIGILGNGIDTKKEKKRKIQAPFESGKGSSR